MRGIEDIRSPNYIVTVLVLRIHRGKLYSYVNVGLLWRTRIEFHGRGVRAKDPGECGSRLGSGKFELACVSDSREACVCSRCVEPGHGTKCRGDDGVSSDHDLSAGRNMGSIRMRTSSLFQK